MIESAVEQAGAASLLRDRSARRGRRPAHLRGRRRRTRELAAALLVTALAAATWPLLAPDEPLAQVGALALVAHASGMLAGAGVVLLLLLVARIPVLERSVGADVLTRWHAGAGRAVVLLVLAHAVAAVLVAQGQQGAGPLQVLGRMAADPALAAALAGTALLLAAAAASVRAARRRVSYETWHGVHLLMYGAVALGFAHQLTGPDLREHPLLQAGWAAAYALAFGAVAHHRVLRPLRQARRHHLRVAQVREEVPGVTTVVVTGEHLDELRALPGQFFRWRFLTRERWRSAHPFSLSAAPTATTLRLTARAVGDGTRSLRSLPVGTRVVVEGPYGVVTPERRTRRDVLLVAGGLGIAPMRALFEAVPLHPGEDLLLLYRTSSEAEVVFREELLDIAHRRGARVVFDVRPRGTPFWPAVLLQQVPDVALRDVYVCGPPGMVEAFRRCALVAGVPPAQVHEERFSL